ncbi:MAG: hypothetical protein IPI59_10545 [Sphingobacteriales bacterium]|jgi:microcin C transport system substrate-binding protein|nr:hypothetical protein [Sphingobacteriales bacterium]MBP9141797.1 hypothetical protein [Chitinophagales bacterium]MDA0199021.1 ABC transporter substrate-binding protein [Bacteroidota bacterium]MBK6889524.1 hypothetical protein [Sphingobacteriales bacterium]MBK7527972.1 hypothetical protein [Sphingobacteriales bacterium]
MKKPIQILLCLTVAFATFILTGCGGGGNETVVESGGTTKGVVVNLDSIPDSLGGKNFEAVAEKLGFKTNSNFTMYGDPNAKRGGKFTMCLDEFPPTYRAVGKDSHLQVLSIMTGLMWETLLGLDTKTMEYTPGLATHWKISEDKMTYWFRLDPRARWSDGNSVTSDDIIATFKLLTDAGIEDPSSNETYGANFETPEKVSPLLFKVKCKRENWRNILYFGGSMKVFPAKYLNKIDGKGYLQQYQYQTFAVTGPYEIDYQKTKQPELLVIKRRADYWGKDDPGFAGTCNFDELHFMFVLDETLRREKFFKGEYDFYIVPKAKWWKEDFVADKDERIKRGLIQRLKVFNFNPAGTSGLAFNTREEPFDDKRVRQAFELLFDFEELNKTRFFNEYERCVSYNQGSVYANPNNPMPSFDPKKAASLLDEAGWKLASGQKVRTKNGKSLEIDLNMTQQSTQEVFTRYQQDLANAGVQLNFKNVTPQEDFKSVMKHQFKISYRNWTGLLFPNPVTSLHSKTADDLETTNITGMKNKRIDELCDLYDKSYDPAERIKLMQEVDGIAVAEKHYGWLWVAPYSVRALHWNKFGYPKSVFTYTGDFDSALTLWWNDPEKEKTVAKGMNDKTVTMPINPEEVDFYGRRSSKGNAATGVK